MPRLLPSGNPLIAHCAARGSAGLSQHTKLCEGQTTLFQSVLINMVQPLQPCRICRVFTGLIHMAMLHQHHGESRQPSACIDACRSPRS